MRNDPVSDDEEGWLKPGWGKAELVGAVLARLAEWERLLAAPVLTRDAALESLAQRSLRLEQPSRQVGFGGVGHHLAELSRLARTAPSVTPVREQLGVVRELLNSAQASLSPEERARACGPPPLAPPAQGLLAPPPLLSGFFDVRGGPGPAPARPAAPAASAIAEPPRMISSFNHSAPPLLSAASPMPGHGAPAASAQRPLPPGAGAAPQPQPAPVAPSPPAGGVHSPVPAAPSRPAQPNLFVRSVLGLRAFGRMGAADAKPPSPAGPPGPSQESSSVLGLQRRNSSPSAPPPSVGGGYGGLPSLREPADHGPRPPLAVGPPLPRGASVAEKQRSGQRTPFPLSSTPARGRPRVASGRLRQRGGQGESRWWIGALAALGVCAVVLGIVLVAVTISRRSDDPSASSANPASPADASAVAANPGPGNSAPNSPASAMPHGKLLNDDERFRSLLAQVHGRGGKTSPELRALMDEQASIAAQALQPGCVGPHCSALKELGKLVTTTTKKRVKRRSQSPAAMRSRWLAGLEMPEIPVEDDPRVQKRFEFYTENPLGRETFQQMLFRCGAYKDMIQSSLIRRGLPKDLIAVAYAESGCYPLAKSPMGAEGLWQFIPDAARAYHLRIIEGVVDERHSPQKSTEAAIQYYSDMYAKFGEWDLAFASYNMGPFGLAARIERVEGEKVGFWELVDAEMLPGETADYAPGIQAIALILNNLQKLKFGAIQQRAPQMTMDLPVPPNTRMSLVARAAATSLDELRRLNLDIKGTSTPNVPNFAVQVAKDSVWQARETLQALLQSKDEGDMCVPQNFDWGRQRFTPEMQQACSRTLSVSAPAEPAPLPSAP